MKADRLLPVMAVCATVALFCAVVTGAQPQTQPGGMMNRPGMTAQTQPASPGGIPPCCAGMMAMMSGSGASGMGGAMGATGNAQVQYSCCPPSAMATMMQGPMRWLPMLIGVLLLLSIIALLLALAVFFVRRSRVGVPARA